MMSYLNAILQRDQYNLLFVMSVILLSFLYAGCDPKTDTLFVLQDSGRTGVDFSNTIIESDTFNIFAYDYIYNGGGVAVGDFNNDGLQDIFFTANMSPNRLYLNKGNFKFDDVTETAKVNLQGRWNS